MADGTIDISQSNVNGHGTRSVSCVNCRGAKTWPNKESCSRTHGIRWGSMSRTPVLSISSPAKWRVLLSPIRSELVQALRCIGPCSVSDLARAVGRPSDLLYRHLGLLERAGFVVQSGARKRGRHVERLVDVTADDFALGLQQLSNKVEQDTVIQTARAFLGTTRKTIEHSARRGALVLDSPQRNFILNYELTRLTPAQFREARALVGRLKQIMDDARASAEGELFASVVVITPVVRSSRRASENAPARPKASQRSSPARQVPKKSDGKGGSSDA